MGNEGHGTEMGQLKVLVDTFSDKIPALRNGLTNVVYGKEASAKFSAALANFYDRLKKGGMADDRAFALTEQYMSPLNLAGLIASAFGKRRRGAA